MAIPTNVIIDGKFIENEIQPASLTVKEEAFNVIADKVKEYVDFNEKDLQVKLAYHAAVVNDEEKVMPVEILDLRNKENTVQIAVFTFHTGNESEIVYKAQVRNEEVYKGFELTRGAISETFSLTEGEIGTFSKPALPDNQDFHIESVEALALDWLSGKFCLDNEKAGKSYKHCGPGCGDGMSKGGGTPINGLDTCCRAHDRCWSNFGKGDKCCDKTLASCIDAYQSQDYATWLQINTYFTPRGLLC